MHSFYSVKQYSYCITIRFHQFSYGFSANHVKIVVDITLKMPPFKASVTSNGVWNIGTSYYVFI